MLLTEQDDKRLAPLAGIKAELYTIQVASKICKDFVPSMKGNRSVNAALNNLPLFFTADEKLILGWAPHHPIHSIDTHQGGYESLAIMLCLGESFHEAYAAKVMHYMASMLGEDDDILPHFAQWKAVVHSCNGMLCTTDFGILVEDNVRLNQYSVGTTTGRSFPQYVSELPISPRRIAATLFELAKILTGKDKSITIIGGGVIGWFASIAEWLYDLKVSIYNKEGELLRQNHDGAAAQVICVYDPNPGVQSRMSDEAVTDHAKVSQCVTDRTSYHTSIHLTPFGGRVTWQSILPKVFGHSYYRLEHEEAKMFSTMIGSAARMFEGFALGEGAKLHPDLISPQNKSNPGSYGPGLIQTLANWLPELRRFQGKMERFLRQTYDEAGKTYVESLTHIRSACRCTICAAKEEVEAENSTVPPPQGYCLTVLVETIISLGLTLSRCTVAPAIFPSRAGIQSFYCSQVDKRVASRGLHWTQHFTNIYGADWNAPDARRLQSSVSIFSGSRPRRDLPDNLVAIAHEGVCAYLLKLEKPTSKAGDASHHVIRIVSGGIHIKRKVYRRMCLGSVTIDGKTDGIWDPEDFWEKVWIEGFDVPAYVK